MEINELLTILTSVVIAFNTLQLGIAAWKKMKPEVKKLELEGQRETVETSNLALEGSQVSITMLLARVEELRADVTNEKEQRKKDADYFRRRIKEIDRELRDYRSWAARLAKQVIETGKQPVPFISTLNESDPLIDAITQEQASLEKEKTKRKVQLKDQEEKDYKEGKDAA